MDIQLEKLELIKRIAETNDFSIIEAIKNVFTSKKKDWWDELTEEQKFEIEESDREIDRREFVNFEDFIQKYI
jgi:hypothetical protein